MLHLDDTTAEQPQNWARPGAGTESLGSGSYSEGGLFPITRTKTPYLPTYQPMRQLRRHPRERPR